MVKLCIDAKLNRFARVGTFAALLMKQLLNGFSKFCAACSINTNFSKPAVKAMMFTIARNRGGTRTAQTAFLSCLISGLAIFALLFSASRTEDFFRVTRRQTIYAKTSFITPLFVLVAAFVHIRIIGDLCMRGKGVLIHINTAFGREATDSSRLERRGLLRGLVKLPRRQVGHRDDDCRTPLGRGLNQRRNRPHQYGSYLQPG